MELKNLRTLQAVADQGSYQRPPGCQATGLLIPFLERKGIEKNFCAKLRFA